MGRVVEADGLANADTLPKNMCAEIWVDVERDANSAQKRFAAENIIVYRVILAEVLHGFPGTPASPTDPAGKKVVVTGSYDWVHSGHVRFFEEVSGTAISRSLWGTTGTSDC